MPRYSLTAPASLAPLLPSTQQVWTTPSSWIRTAAFVWDALPFLVVYQALAMMFVPTPEAFHILMDPQGYTGPLPSPEAFMSQLLGYASQLLALGAFVWLGYAAWHVAFEAIQGTTPGKWLVGLRVSPGRPGAPTQDQAGLGWKVALIRFAAAALSWATLNVGHALGWWRKDRAMLHDLLSQTQVVVDHDVVLASWILSPSHHRAACGLALGLIVLVFVLHIVVFAYQVRALAAAV